MDGVVAFYIIGGVIVTWVFFWAIGSIRRNSVKSANNTAVAAGLVGRVDDMKCPKCKEFIKPDAEVCRHCGFDAVQKDSSVIAQLDFRRTVDVQSVIKEQTNRQIIPIRIALITSISLTVLSFTPFSPLYLIPVFGAFVVIGSWLSTVILLPIFFSKSRKARQEVTERVLRGNQ